VYKALRRTQRPPFRIDRKNIGRVYRTLFRIYRALFRIYRGLFPEYTRPPFRIDMGNTDRIYIYKSLS